MGTIIDRSAGVQRNAPEPAPGRFRGEPAAPAAFQSYDERHVSLTAELKSHNTSDGGITLGAKNLYELIANAPGDEVTLKSASYVANCLVLRLRVIVTMSVAGTARGFIESLWSSGDLMFDHVKIRSQ